MSGSEEPAEVGNHEDNTIVVPSEEARIATAITPSAEKNGLPNCREVAARLWREMRESWANGERLPAEHFLRLNSDFANDEQFCLDVIYAEYALRDERGERPDIEEFVRRFPQFASAMRRQFILHLAWSEEEREGDDPLPEESERSLPTEKKLSCPALFGKYFVISELGSGGQADVYRAIHPALGKEVVLKVSRIPLKTGEDLSHLEREGQILATLEHPNLAQVFDLGVHDGHPYLVLEFIRGQTLFQLRQQGPVSPDQATKIILKVAGALKTIHEMGITHRDVTPKNVVVDSSGEPRLIDFGLAQWQTPWTVESVQALSGTLSFMAPEQAMPGSVVIDQRADIFGLGALLYFLLTGVPPYQRANVGDLFKCVQAGDWDRKALADKSLPHHLSQICDRCLKKDPVQRFQTAGELIAALEHCLQSPRRFRRKVLFAVVTVALIASGFAWQAINNSKVPKTLPTDGIASVRPATNGESASKIALAPPKLNLKVWRQGRYADLTAAVPLHSGDQLQVVTTVPAGLFASLFLLNSTGKLQELATYSSRDSEQSVRYPVAVDQAVPLEGPPGTEFVFLCARPGSPFSLHELRDAWKPPSEWPPLSPATVLRLSSQALVAEQRDRGFGAPMNRPNPEAAVSARLKELQASLVKAGFVFDGLAFSHAD